ncbi:hypothetical protein AQJ66_34430 [Streptomyces bungoensis]|uniref:DUF4232 domain-containing protein n=1 Tax=Streptomyces bungoensis TaxID=285568 RepID=A0A117R8K1_9ACTN|nr:DUF4232 domain-containing protein [Streptomyces bungoensis]KUN77055.1 hypothetical protein AQJ66_34430 [Streptomyces bungoensis]
MQNRTAVRVTASALTAVAAVLSLSACQPGDSTPTGKAPAGKSPSTPVSSPKGPAPATSRPSSGGTATAPAAPASPASATSAGTAPTCAATALKATARQAADRPDGTGTGAAVVEFTNVSARPCTVTGHPTVAGAGNGSPERNKPLTVTPAGAATAVRLAPGGKAWVKLTFVQVQGEGDGYCASGARPVAYPTLVVGLPGSGAQQVALDDGLFAECDNKVTATAVSTVKPA